MTSIFIDGGEIKIKNEQQFKNEWIMQSTTDYVSIDFYQWSANLSALSMSNQKAIERRKKN